MYALGPKLVQAPVYQQASPARKEELIRNMYKGFRQIAMDDLIATNPKLAAAVKASRKVDTVERKKLAERGVDFGAKVDEVVKKAPEGNLVGYPSRAFADDPGEDGLLDHPPAPPPPKKGDVNQMADDVASLVGIDPNLLRVVIRQESGGNPKALGPRTPHSGGQRAAGLMQVLPSTFETVRDQVEAITGKRASVSNPTDNLIAGAIIYKQLLDQTGGDVAAAARLYHGGPDLRIHGRKTYAYGRAISAAYSRTKREGA